VIKCPVVFGTESVVGFSGTVFSFLHMFSGVVCLGTRLLFLKRSAFDVCAKFAAEGAVAWALKSQMTPRVCHSPNKQRERERERERERDRQTDRHTNKHTHTHTCTHTNHDLRRHIIREQENPATDSFKL
jgi:hypothetical protein